MNLEKMKTGSKKAFTLIELLVVITIIGILATGAVSVYTSQIQKSRDSNRISSVEALKSGLEQAYQDKGAYPNAGTGTSSMDSFLVVKKYTPKLPIDPKTGQKSGTSNFDYTYAVGADANLIVGQIYEISTHFENSGNLTEKAAKDGGQDNNRYEAGISTDTLLTSILQDSDVTSWVNTARFAASSCSTAVTAGTASAAPVACLTTESTSNINTSVLVIR